MAELIGSPRTTLVYRSVFLVILLSALIVLKSILDHRDTDHKQQRHQSGNCSTFVKETGDRQILDNYHDEEVEVSHLRELFKQILWQESETIVLCRHNLVRYKVSVALLLSENLVHLKYSAGCCLLLICRSVTTHRSRPSLGLRFNLVLNTVHTAFLESKTYKLSGFAQLLTIRSVFSLLFEPSFTGLRGVFSSSSISSDSFSSLPRPKIFCQPSKRDLP